MAIVEIMVDQVGPSTSKGIMRNHEVLIDRPEAKGGADRGAMGGELLLAALGGCFMSTLLAAIRSRQAPVSEVRIAVAGTLEGTPSRFTAVRMTVAAACDDKALLEKLVTISERSCIVANTLKGALPLEIRLESAAVSPTSS